MRKLIKNPLSQELSVVINGVKYSLGPKEEKVLDLHVVDSWKRTHGFLEVSNEVQEQSAKIELKPQEDVVVSVGQIEIKEEKPKIKLVPKKKK